MQQAAPDPIILRELVASTHYRPGWRVWLSANDYDRGQGSIGLTLMIQTEGYNAYHPERGQTYCVNHLIPVPPAAYDRRSWRRWLFEQFCLVERHETAEFFECDGEHPFAPSHGPGNDPYLLREVGTDEDRRTSFRGTLNA